MTINLGYAYFYKQHIKFYGWIFYIQYYPLNVFYHLIRSIFLQNLLPIRFQKTNNGHTRYYLNYFVFPELVCVACCYERISLYIYVRTCVVVVFVVDARMCMFFVFNTYNFLLVLVHSVVVMLFGTNWNWSLLAPFFLYFSSYLFPGFQLVPFWGD